jgi:hypothetical protein
MRFTLTYRGPLPSDGKPRDKAAIRDQLHPQLEQLWRQEPLSLMHASSRRENEGRDPFERTVGGFEFRSLVHSRLRLRAELDVLMLRAGSPGHIVVQGDIDNRLKTLFDGLCQPNKDQIPSGWQPPGTTSPTCCLLEDDRFVTRLNVEVVQLLDPPAGAGKNYVELLVQVRVHTAEPSYASMMFLT